MHLVHKTAEGNNYIVFQLFRIIPIVDIGLIPSFQRDDIGENKITVLSNLIPGNDKDKEKKTHPNC